MTNYEIARLGDAHCHLSTSLTLEASKAVVELVNKQYQLPSRLLHKHPGSGIGEIGLDKMFRIPSNGYYGNQDSNNSEVKLSACRVKIDHQVAILRVMLQLANDLQRPVSLHCVKAHGPLFDIVREYHQIPQVILHSFSGSVDQGRRWVAEYRKRDQDLGFSFSHYINGVEDKRSQLNELVGYLDDSQILIETDISIDKHLERDYTDHLFGIAETIRVSRGWDLERFYAIIKQNLYKHTH
ncbi:Cut9-interacting protein scn1 [Yamadazyma tenuis]|uniref:Cut9-interacting protein scn1 n=1 Tax=Candida tenuis TaxID=2315449 RepID=UPI0027A37134|nr:Cut9-interacting protein scn1 [Yamadazyma tenuis]